MTLDEKHHTSSLRSRPTNDGKSTSPRRWDTEAPSDEPLTKEAPDAPPDRRARPCLSFPLAWPNRFSPVLSSPVLGRADGLGPPSREAAPRRPRWCGPDVAFLHSPENTRGEALGLAQGEWTRARVAPARSARPSTRPGRRRGPRGAATGHGGSSTQRTQVRGASPASYSRQFGRGAGLGMRAAGGVD